MTPVDQGVRADAEALVVAELLKIKTSDGVGFSAGGQLVRDAARTVIGMLDQVGPLEDHYVFALRVGAPDVSDTPGMGGEAPRPGLVDTAVSPENGSCSAVGDDSSTESPAAEPRSTRCAVCALTGEQLDETFGPGSAERHEAQYGALTRKLELVQAIALLIAQHPAPRWNGLINGWLRGGRRAEHLAELSIEQLEKALRDSEYMANRLDEEARQSAAFAGKGKPSQGAQR